MKKFIKTFLFSIFIFLISDKVYANNIDSINMDIYLDKYGNANITEEWNANLTDGTEGFRYFGNLGNSTITNYSVRSESRDFSQYSSDNSWNVNASFSEKAYKYGINNNNGNKELCFGISSYGHHKYTLSYTVTGFVGQTEDSQVLYWELIPTDLAKLTNNIYIKIHADQKFSDTLDVWGYGNYGGYAYVYDGYIEVSNQNLRSDEYVTVLVKFPNSTFETNNNIGNNFDYYYNMAEAGAEHYVDNSSSVDNSFAFIPFLVFGFNFIIWVLIIVFISKVSKNSNYSSGKSIINFGTKGRKISKDTPMFRDIPCNKDIYMAYWIAYNYKMMGKQTDFLGAILLKWLKEDKIRINSNSTGTIFKKEDTTITFVLPVDDTLQLETELETKLYKYMYEASKDGILESKEFEVWCKNHYNKILNWFDKVLDYQNEKLVNMNLLKPVEKTTLKIFKSTEYLTDEKLYEEAVKMKGLKNFFEEFDNMSDKEAIEVKFWQEYLMYAQILGVAEKVAKQFKKLYPDIIQDYTYNSVLFIHTISYTGMSSASRALSRAQSYSSGGGGFSSGGGGGGSFGSGGGGGFR